MVTDQRHARETRESIHVARENNEKIDLALSPIRGYTIQVQKLIALYCMFVVFCY